MLLIASQRQILIVHQVFEILFLIIQIKDDEQPNKYSSTSVSIHSDSAAVSVHSNMVIIITIHIYNLWNMIWHLMIMIIPHVNIVLIALTQIMIMIIPIHANETVSNDSVYCFDDKTFIIIRNYVKYKQECGNGARFS